MKKLNDRDKYERFNDRWKKYMKQRVEKAVVYKVHYLLGVEAS